MLTDDLNLKAQLTKVDSLRKQLEIQQVDSLLLETLNRLAWTYRTIDLDSMKFFSVKAHYLLDMKTSPRLKIQTLNNLGAYYMAVGSLDSAQFCYSRSKAIAEKSGIKLALSGVYNNLAIIKKHLGDYDSAIEYYKKSLVIKEEFQYTKGILTTHLNLYIILYQTKHYEESMAYLNLILSDSSINDYPLLQARALNNKAVTFIELGEFGQAFPLLREAYDCYIKNELTTLLPEVLTNLGLFHYRQQHYDSAAFYFNSSVELSSQYGTLKSSKEPLLNLARVYLRTQNYEKGLSALDQLNQIFSESQDLFLFCDMYQYYGDLYEAKGDYLSALKYFNKWLVFRDSIENSKNLRSVTHIKTLYETQKKDNDILRLTNQTQQQNIALAQSQILQIVLGGIAIILGISIWSLIHNRRQSIRIAKFKSQASEQQRIARELHDGIVADLLRIEQMTPGAADEVKKDLAKTRESLRSYSHRLDALRKSQGTLTDMFTDYFRHWDFNKLDVKLDFLPGRFDLKNTGLKADLYRITQELIANTLKHSSANKSLLRLKYTDRKLEFLYEDNGDHFDPKLKENGFGLENIKERAISHKGKLSMNMSKEGFSMSITFHIKKSAIQFS